MLEGGEPYVSHCGDGGVGWVKGCKYGQNGLITAD